jgi:hypothetical protein
MRTSELVQRLQIARRELALEGALAKLDKYHLLILDGRSCQKPQIAREFNRVLTYLKAALNHAWHNGMVPSDDAWRRHSWGASVGTPRRNRVRRRRGLGFGGL